MSFATTMNAIMRNNRRIRVSRINLFNKDITKVKKQKAKPIGHKHLSDTELELIREELKEERHKRILIQASVIIVLVLFVGIVIYLFLFHLDPDSVNIFKRIKSYFDF